MQDGIYGVSFNGSLIPEVLSVKKDSISIGRFEVTNAQYAAWKSSHSYAAVHANRPVTGISYEDANAYIEWLSKLTGDTYRLPNKEEAESLQKTAIEVAGSENVLNYWAGYDMNVLDVEEFREKLSEVQHSMLMNVGSFKGTKVGMATVYDIGGNAAEYHTGEQDHHIYGYSANSYVDPYASVQKPDIGYIGFRVVKE